MQYKIELIQSIQKKYDDSDEYKELMNLFQFLLLDTPGASNVKREFPA